jgi:hypothetical protein
MASKTTLGEKLCQDILDNLQAHPVKRYSEAEKELAKEIDEKIINLIKNIDLGKLSANCVKSLDKFYFESDQFSFCSAIYFWEEYKQLNHYIQAQDQEKPELLDKLKIKLLEIKSNILMSPKFLDKVFVRSIYGSHCSELIHMFEEIFPLPPLSVFDAEQQPPRLVKRAAERASDRAIFDARNAGDRRVEEKIQFLQRFIRAKIRAECEVERIGKRYFKDLSPETRKTQAEEIIKEANTPYRPRLCNPELAERIVKAASQIKLFDSVSHLLDANYVDVILDGYLQGRKNLIDSYMPFRPAALTSADIENGDGNVICFGPNIIDPRCLRDRTVRLELDLDVLTSQEEYKYNPTLFFKQFDLGYDIGARQLIQIGKMDLIFTHTASLRCPIENCANLQLFSSMDNCDKVDYFGVERKDLFISSNIKQMHSILILNFFRPLDNLKNVYYAPAPGKIKEIYDSISKLNDQELKSFLSNLGKKMSCSSEFNTYAAYKIDLNALRSVAIYEGKSQIESISISDLCDKLNQGNFESLNKLERLLPEIFRSARFMAFLHSNVKNTAALEKLESLRSFHARNCSENF